MLGHRNGPRKSKRQKTAPSALLELTERVKNHSDEDFSLHLGDDKNREQVLDLRLLAIDNWKEALRGNTAIRTVEVWVQAEEASSEKFVNSIVLKEMGKLSNLETIHIRGYCDAMPARHLSLLLNKAKKLETLQLTSVKLSGTERDAEALSRALAGAPSLREVKWHDISLKNSSDLFLTSLFMGLAETRNLESFYLSPSTEDALGDYSTASLVALMKSSTLRKLAIPRTISDLYEVWGDYYKDICKVLSENRTKLQSLEIPFLYHQWEDLGYVASALRNNTTLNELTLNCFGYDDRNDYPSEYARKLMDVVQALHETKIKRFSMVGEDVSFEDDILQALALAPKVNHSLCELNILGVLDNPKYSSDVKYNCLLNTHGRASWSRYHYGEPNKKPKGRDIRRIMQVEIVPSEKRKDQHHDQCPLIFLSTVNQDLDVLYYYLSIVNPFILEHIQNI